MTSLIKSDKISCEYILDDFHFMEKKSLLGLSINKFVIFCQTLKIVEN